MEDWFHNTHKSKLIFGKYRKINLILLFELIINIIDYYFNWNYYFLNLIILGEYNLDAQ